MYSISDTLEDFQNYFIRNYFSLVSLVWWKWTRFHIWIWECFALGTQIRNTTHIWRTAVLSVCSMWLFSYNNWKNLQISEIEDLTYFEGQKQKVFFFFMFFLFWATAALLKWVKTCGQTGELNLCCPQCTAAYAHGRPLYHWAKKAPKSNKLAVTYTILNGSASWKHEVESLNGPPDRPRSLQDVGAHFAVKCMAARDKLI